MSRVLRCRCCWNPLGPTEGAEAERCPNPATQEDGICDWCARYGSRTEEQLRQNPKALVSPEGEYMGLGGAGEVHDVVHGSDGRPVKLPCACWYPDSDRVLLQGSARGRGAVEV